MKKEFPRSVLPQKPELFIVTIITITITTIITITIITITIITQKTSRPLLTTFNNWILAKGNYRMNSYLICKCLLPVFIIVILTYVFFSISFIYEYEYFWLCTWTFVRSHFHRMDGYIFLVTSCQQLDSILALPKTEILGK